MNFSWLKAAILGLAAASGVVACSAQSEPDSASARPRDPTTQVSNELRLGRNTHITSAQYTITCPGGFSKTGSIDVSRLLELEGTIPNVPVPGPCTVTLTAKSTDGNVSCSGSKSGLTVTCPGTREKDEKGIVLACARNHVGREWGDLDWRANTRSFEVGAEINLACAAPDGGVDAAVDSGVDTGADSGGDCVPLRVCPAGDNCGPRPDGCGGVINCGTCTGGQTCGATSPNVCGGCRPITCAGVGATCGQVADGCGGTLNCGSCQAPDSCIGNKCSCVSTTQCPANSCDTITDNCGNLINCNRCPFEGYTCQEGICVCVGGCIGNQICGVGTNGYGCTFDCGTCPQGTYCNPTGTACTPTCITVTSCPAGDNCGTICRWSRRSAGI